MAVPDPVSAVAVPRDLAGGTPAVETEGEAESSAKPALSSPRVAASSSSSPRSATVTVGFFDLGLPRRRDASSVCYLLRADAMYILSSLCFCSPGTQLFSELDKMCRKKRAIGLYGKNGMLFFAARPSLAARPRCPWVS